MPAKENYLGYSSTGDHGIHGLFRESVSSDTLSYLLDPEVLLSDSLAILKSEFGSFGTFLVNRTLRSFTPPLTATQLPVRFSGALQI